MYKVIEKFGIKSGVLFIIMVLSLYSCNQDNYAKIDANYGEEVVKYAKEYNLSPAYLKALIVLECSGNKPAGERFEPSVYQKLKEVQNGTRSRFEFVTRKQIRDCSDAALRNLATSWGPFQIMGYKCIHLGIIINDLRGDESIKWGVKWINNEYGKLVRNKDFEKAFRVHNTGSVNGNTYDPNYVSNGLQHIDHFDAGNNANSLTDLPKKYVESTYLAKYDLEDRLVIFVDYAKPRTQRRLWVIENNKVLANSYVSHGVGSGSIKASEFSNVRESNMSSLGIFAFDYFLNYQKRPGKKGYKFVLHGLEPTNNQAAKRNIVIHLPPTYNEYVSEQGCFGNSKGCFVVSKEVFTLIKEKSAFRTSYLLAMN